MKYLMKRDGVRQHLGLSKRIMMYSPPPRSAVPTDPPRPRPFHTVSPTAVGSTRVLHHRGVERNRRSRGCRDVRFAVVCDRRPVRAGVHRVGSLLDVRRGAGSVTTKRTERASRRSAHAAAYIHIRRYNARRIPLWIYDTEELTHDGYFR